MEPFLRGEALRGAGSSVPRHPEGGAERCHRPPPDEREPSSGWLSDLPERPQRSPGPTQWLQFRKRGFWGGVEGESPRPRSRLSTLISTCSLQTPGCTAIIETLSGDRGRDTLLGLHRVVLLAARLPIFRGGLRYSRYTPFCPSIEKLKSFF